MNYKISDKYREKNLSEWGKPNYERKCIEICVEMECIYMDLKQNWLFKKQNEANAFI